jgi:hypothetical protein
MSAQTPLRPRFTPTPSPAPQGGGKESPRVPFVQFAVSKKCESSSRKGRGGVTRAPSSAAIGRREMCAYNKGACFMRALWRRYALGLTGEGIPESRGEYSCPEAEKYDGLYIAGGKSVRREYFSAFAAADARKIRIRLAFVHLIVPMEGGEARESIRQETMATGRSFLA